MIRKSYILTALALGFAILSHAQQNWVGTWAAAAEFTGKGDMPASPLTNRSLREVVKVSVGADCLRLRLSNEFSKEPVEIKSVFIADALDSCRWEAHGHHPARSVCRE